MVSTLAGSGAASWVDGVGTAAGLSRPGGVVVSSGGIVFISEIWNNMIRRISTSGQYILLTAKFNNSIVCWLVDIKE